ncbi:MAG: hypothetical protein A3F46_06320 [Legionellales bacterium RIFCSPHIGHO2_12_FULL_42_9]|nr:MAG: hypothetical protein A3F46_06320 [Legionellales bacterium RIFCSPHIGHO2_12_FULL_42_9]
MAIDLTTKAIIDRIKVPPYLNPSLLLTSDEQTLFALHNSHQGGIDVIDTTSWLASLIHWECVISEP